MNKTATITISKKPGRFAVCMFAACASAMVLAHHSPARFDTRSEVMLEGIVTELSWRNPHVYLTLAMTGANGELIEQKIEAGPVYVLNTLGLTKDALAEGERIKVRANPGRNGSGKIAQGLDLTKTDGTYLPLHLSARSLVQALDTEANSIVGSWVNDPAAFVEMRAAMSSWPLTAAALATRDSPEYERAQADCVPYGIPQLMLISVATSIRIENNQVIFAIDWMETSRTVHLDLAEHPQNLVPSLLGHSIGHWEADTLVVDTVGFTAQTEGLGFGLPSSTEKHVIERFSLADDRKKLIYEITIEDPQYLLQPVSYSGAWNYRPEIKPSGEVCDPEVAARFLTE